MNEMNQFTAVSRRRRHKKRPKVLFVCLLLLAFLATIAAALSRFPLREVPPDPSPAKKQEPVSDPVSPPPAKEEAPAVPADPPAETPAQPGVYDYTQPVPQSDAVDDSYFANTLFIGNSITDGISHYGIIKGATVWASNGLMVDEVFVKPVVKTSGNKKITIPQALSQQSFDKIYIMLGLNELGWNSLKSFTDHYATLIDLLREKQPNAVIYAQGLLPVSAERSQTDKVFNNDRVQLFNQLIQSVCSEKQVYFVDAGKGVADQSGCMPAEASPDGVHMNKAMYYQWYDYLKSHIVTTGDK